jgi:1-aminocyclopropane-1-carboxylate deaminase/D-cysteine desulfhydrase-like pyridoxal-dependent ACC family enzyme
MRVIKSLFSVALFTITVSAHALTSQELSTVSLKIESIREIASNQREKLKERTDQQVWMNIASQITNSALNYKVAALELAIIEKQCNVPISKVVFPMGKPATNMEAFNASVLFAHLSNIRFIDFLKKMEEIDPSQSFGLVAKKLEAAQEGVTPYLEKLAQKYATQ